VVIRKDRRGGLEICEPDAYSWPSLRARWRWPRHDLMLYVIPAIESNAANRLQTRSLRSPTSGQIDPDRLGICHSIPVNEFNDLQTM